MSSNSAIDLTLDERATLRALARASIQTGLVGERLTVQPEAYTPALRAPGATFVTLHIDSELRGCIGTLEARDPLVLDVVANAYGAAYRDPRFPALTRVEFERLDLHISILSPPEPLAVESEEDLLTQLRPGIDGLILSEGRRRGTFLPAVWDALPEPRLFVQHLKQKAGLPTDYWSATLTVARYTTESIS